MDVVYVPWGTGIDEAVELGAAWLRQQPGDRLVLVTQMQVYRRNELLPRLTAGAKVAKPITMWSARWQSGPVLAPWPDEGVLSTIADSRRITSVCLLEWGEDAYLRTWVRAHGGADLPTGRPAPGKDELLSPVVTTAMEFLAQAVNHANGLVQVFDKALAVQTLRALIRAGYSYDVDDLVAWAMAHGFTGSELPRLREYATKVLQGHRFRLGLQVLRDDVVEQWEKEARLRGPERD